ncbi:glycosyltransferase [Sciscionella marina]|uniref:glycosyltransferase n=1 Tax=Sciscionella marina TaxID=508770 RepID=UPI000376D219|nr:glycosyltransferase [Sciscionella marina]
MSRFLFVVPPLVGHINPTVGVAGCLAEAGHEVAWVGDAEMVRTLAGDRHPIYDCSTEVVLGRRPPQVRHVEALRYLWEGFLIPLGEAMVPGVLAAVEEFGPDVLVVDQQAFAGALVAEQLGIPWVTSATTSAAFDDPLIGLPKIEAWVRDQLDGLWARFGHATRVIDPQFSPTLVLAFTTRALLGPEHEPQPTVRFVGPSIAERPADADFPWHTWKDERPAVLVTLGTANVDAGGDFLSRCATALAERDIRAVIVDPGGVLGPQPPHVLVRGHVPQLSVLPQVDAVVCHAGHNTVCETLWHGLPLALAPIRDDQPVVTKQVVEAGAGVRLRFARSGAERIGAAIDEVLTEPSYRDSALRIRDSFQAAGGAPTAAAELAEVPAKVTGRITL